MYRVLEHVMFFQDIFYICYHRLMSFYIEDVVVNNEPAVRYIV